MRTVLIVLMLCGLLGAAQAQSQAPLAFKGLRIGGKATPETVFAATGVSCGVGANEMQVCNGSTTIAEASADANIVISKTGVLQRMSFHIDSENFDGVFLALVEKLGNPQSLKEPTVQNGFGAKFQDLIAVWRRPQGLELRAHRFGVNRDRAVIIFTTESDRALLYGDRSPKKLAKDL